MLFSFGFSPLSFANLFMFRRLVRSRVGGLLVVVKTCLLDLRCVSFVFVAVLGLSFFSCVLFVAYSFPHIIMAAVSYMLECDIRVRLVKGNSSKACGRSLESWMELVRALLSKHVSMELLSGDFNVPVRTLHTWKMLANKYGVVQDDTSAVRAFVLQQKGMRLDTRRLEKCVLKPKDRLRIFRQLFQSGAPLQSVAAVLHVSRSRLMRARSRCIKEKVNWSSDFCLRTFLEVSGINRKAKGGL